jgi:hypothetical protein
VKRTIIAALIGLFILPATAQAAFSGQPGRLAFDSSGSIYTIMPDATSFTRLADGSNPRWSPSGNRIAFVRNGDIWVMDALGGHQRQITFLGDATEPAWSASGRRIAFVRRGERSNQGNIWIMSRNGTAMRQLTNWSSPCGGNSHPSWSPSGHPRITFGHLLSQEAPGGGCYVGPWRVVTVNLATGHRRVIPDAQQPDFTSDGRGIVWIDDQGFVEVSSATGASPVTLTQWDCIENDYCLESWAVEPGSTFSGTVGLAQSITNSYTDDIGNQHGYVCLVGASCNLPPTMFMPADIFMEHLDWQPLP